MQQVRCGSGVAWDRGAVLGGELRHPCRQELVRRTAGGSLAGRPPWTPTIGCANITHMDKQTLGRRLAQVREEAGVTQEALGRAVGLDRTAITRLEVGQRTLSVPELAAIADVLHRPLTYFVTAPVPAVVSRRRDHARAHDSTRSLDLELEEFAMDVRTLTEMRLLAKVDRNPTASTPRDHVEAERLAQDVRASLDLGQDPLGDLGEVCGRLGLMVYAASLGANGPDGGCVDVTEAAESLGAAVVNGQMPPGRRRMTLVHELGHWLCGDAYDDNASGDAERMINSFAIHFLAPRAGVESLWRQGTDGSVRDRALRTAASFRLSWSAAVSQLRNLGLLDTREHDVLSADEPRRGDYVRLGLFWREELASPYLAPQFAAACLNGYTEGRLTAERVVELLRGTVGPEELPETEAVTLDSLRRAFAGHDD